MRSLTERHEDAEDLAAETVYQAQRKIKAFRGESSLKTWVHRVAYFEFTHWKRRQRLAQRPTPPPCGLVDPYGAVDDAEALRTGLLELPEALRQPFILHEINELQLAEIALILDLPIGTVKSRLFHERKRLRELWSGAMEEEACRL
jgi:RNA polymerase sigma-70 factor (ECF subfamily)